MDPVRPAAPAVSLLSTSAAAAQLGVSERTVRRYIALGWIGALRLPGGHYRIPGPAIAEFWVGHDCAPDPARRRPRDADGPQPGPRPARQHVDAARGLVARREAQVAYDVSDARLAQLRARFS